MHDFIIENQKALTKDDLIAFAGRLGLDRKKFVAALDGQVYRLPIEQDLAEARSRGVTGVPVFFVGEKRFDGIPTLSEFKEVIEEQLKRVQVAVASQ